MTLVYPIKPRPLAELSSDPNFMSNFSEPIQAMLILPRPSDSKPQYGAFKVAIKAKIDPPVAGLGGKSNICAKQFFFKSKEKKLVQDGKKQAELLAPEVICLTWAVSLLAQVHIFVTEQLRTRGVPPFPIPSMRFVRAAYAVEVGGDGDVFLLEELIEGKFTKLINNASADISDASFISLEDADRAEYLSFAQHVMFWKTKGLAFVSDFQGWPSNEKLTLMR